MLTKRFAQQNWDILKYLLERNVFKSMVNNWMRSGRSCHTICSSDMTRCGGSPVTTVIDKMHSYESPVKRGRYDDQYFNNYGEATSSTVGHSVFQSNNLEGQSVIRVNCGELRREDVGKTVQVVGKMTQQKMGKFIHLKDTYGTTQLILPDHRVDLIKRFVKMPLNSYISVIGLVSNRPQNSKNEKMNTGDIEIVMDRFEMVKVNRGPNINLNKLQQISTRQYSTSAQHSVALTAEEYKLCSGHKYYEEHLKLRSETCGSLDNNYNKRLVEIMGWMHRIKLPKFLHIKDGYGIVQCIISDNEEVQAVIQNVKPESLIKVRGIVSYRPESNINMNVQTGNIEIIVKSLTLIDPNEKPTNTINPLEQEQLHLESVLSREGGVNSNCWRTHTCGELRNHNVGERVKLCGWLEHHRMNKFFILRDAYGSTQCIVNHDGVSSNGINVKTLNLESILEVEGTVALRPEGNVNIALPTGGIEIVVDKMIVHNAATFHPFPIRSFQKAKEPLRMQYRYLDLRFPEMQTNLRIRSNIVMNMRKYLCDDHNFVEVETPTLFCATPGGAQEFVVPTRHKGRFYSLVQSPQQFKQILMAGSIDRYFQIARCYRDEDIHSDRQPEFTQLDIEMSFVGRDEIMNLMEGLLRRCWPNPEQLPSVIPRLTYKQAMEKYGTDKPDLNINCEMKNITHLINQNEKSDIHPEDNIGLAILLKKVHIGKSLKQTLTTMLHKQSIVNGFIRKVKDDVNTNKEVINVVPFNNEQFVTQLFQQLGVESNDWLIVTYGPWEETCLFMGDLRTMLSSHVDTRDSLRTDTCSVKPLWVVDFPLFNKSCDGSHLKSCHHPFTAPHPEDCIILDSEPLKVRSLAYDLVLNGNEIGGGSVRAHNIELQKKLLRMLNIPEEPLNHLLQALASGCPPHAGIALGLDRFVSLACGAASIRDVIAFPKSVEGRDLLSGAPSSISEHDRHIYHIT